MHKSILTSVLCAALGGSSTHAAINIPSNGSDGELVVTANTVIDLSLASANRWDADNSARAGTGTYDSDKRAVVFHYTSVSIAAGATVTFKNHPSRAPVVWLVKGSVTIQGTLSLDGEPGRPAPELAEPGPGGFRGGCGQLRIDVGESRGFGPGAALIAPSGGLGGMYGTGDAAYGNQSCVPLIGGSGGGGHHGGVEGGGGGGGAILIACADQLSVPLSGSIRANGGKAYWTYGGAGGSGGAIRLVCDVFSGSGRVTAIGGDAYLSGSFGGMGRIRIERVTEKSSIDPIPETDPVRLSLTTPPVIWLPEDGPTVKIVSIGGLEAPPDPRAEFGLQGADVVLPQVTTTPVEVETTNVEEASLVEVHTTPRAKPGATKTNLTVDRVLSQNPLRIRWTNNVPVQNGYAAMQVKVVRP